MPNSHAARSTTFPQADAAGTVPLALPPLTQGGVVSSFVVSEADASAAAWMLPLGEIQAPQHASSSTTTTTTGGAGGEDVKAGASTSVPGAVGVCAGSPAATTTAPVAIESPATTLAPPRAAVTASGVLLSSSIETRGSGGSMLGEADEAGAGPSSVAWSVRPSRKAARTCNPVRNIVDHLKPSPSHGPDKPLLNFSLGDPTVYGNLPPPTLLLEAMVEQLTLASGGAKPHGYQCSAGAPEARRALAAAHSYGPGTQLTAEDVVITSGGSGALEIAISALLDEGDALLVPRPGFALYQVITESLGGTVQPYRLLPEKGWEVDLQHLESLVTPRTKAIVVNNPSNPCSSVLSKENLLGVLAVAARHKLPVIADEIYGDMVFEGHAFHPLGALTTEVPVLTIGGLAKQFAVPGWRVGWILLHDPLQLLSTPPSPPPGPGAAASGGGISVRQGIKNLTQIIIGANTLCQAVIPTLFPQPPAPAAAGRDRSCSTISEESLTSDEAGSVTTTSSSSSSSSSLAAHRAHYVGTLEANARFLVDRVRGDPRLQGRVTAPSPPQGAMYCMLRLEPGALADGLGGDDVAFCARLLEEENVVLLPGQAFGIAGYVRFVMAPPREMLAQGLDRLAAFVERHATAAVGV